MSHPLVRCLLLPCSWLALAAFVGASGQAAERITSLDALRTARAQLAAQPRRLIANNDGCDCLYFPRDLEPTPQNFLDRRTSLLAGSQVGAISYCTISSGFGQFTHATKVGALLTRQSAGYGIKPDTRNITADLIRQGTDPLRAVTDFTHAHRMESFWSMRMNDTHDVAHTPQKPYLLFPQLKVDHPEWLVGDHLKRTPHGRWSSVDYAHAEIRELAFRYVEEVCRGYAVDGVELDFFRHLCYFRSVANGGQASPEEIGAMTGLMRRIRTMTEEVGMERGRPILIAMRLPDSVEFCRESGLDLAAWLEEGLMDLLITTDYFRLNPWSYSVALGHRHGVKVYPALTDPRVKGETRFRRDSTPAYRARAAAAWAAGADGLSLFNLYDLDHLSPLWNELGDPPALAFTDKLYFLTDLDGKPAAWLAGGGRHQKIPVLTPTAPVQLVTRQVFETHLAIADDLAAASRAGREAVAVLHLDLPGLDDPRRISVALNGRDLTNGTLHEGWLDWPVPPNLLRTGDNQLAITLHPDDPEREKEWTLTYEGNRKPGPPWRRDAGSVRTHEAISDGALLLADRGGENGDYCYYRTAWGADPDGETVAEARVKVVSGSSFLIFTNGLSGERLDFTPTGIALYHQRQHRHEMTTTDDFHRYRLTIKGRALQVHVDDVLRLETPEALAPRPGYPRNELAFGSSNSTATGEALWAGVKLRAARQSQPLQDVVVSVSYRKP